MPNLPPWLHRLKRTLPAWTAQVRHPAGPGRYRYALDAYEPYDLDASHMMHNVVFTTSAAAELPGDEQRRRWIDYLLSHQREADGLMIDPALERHLRGATGEPTDEERFTMRLWTTRNALMSVAELGGKPRYPLRHRQAFSSGDELVRFIETLDWSRPWGAGSRTGALVLFQHFNRLLGDERAAEAIDAAVRWLVAHQSPETGAWSRGEGVPLHQLINGVMKVWIQVLPIADLPVQYPERVIDLCIRGLREDELIAGRVEACSVFDVALVLDIALRATDHRRDEVAELAGQMLPRFEAMLAPDGALSYYPGRSLNDHSRLDLAPVKHQSDVVGTALHSHAIALLASLAGCRNELGWTPLTEWRMRLGQTVG